MRKSCSHIIEAIVTESFYYKSVGDAGQCSCLKKVVILELFKYDSGVLFFAVAF